MASALCFAGFHSAPESVLLRYRFRPGETDRYSIELQVRVESDAEIEGIGPYPVRGFSSTSIHVVSVRKDGTALLRVRVAPVRAAGSTSEPGAAQSMVYQMTPRGLTAIPDAARSPENLLVNPSALARIGTVFPAGPVKPGDRWTWVAPNPLQKEGKVLVKARFFARESVEGREAVRIHQALEAPLRMSVRSPGSGEPVQAVGALRVTSAVYFSPKLGKILRASVYGQGRLTLTPANGDPVRMTLKTDVISKLE